MQHLQMEEGNGVKSTQKELMDVSSVHLYRYANYAILLLALSLLIDINLI